MLKKSSLNDQVIDLILSKIKDGELKPGEKLDSQDDFAAKLGVSRSTVREAFSKLASMGIIEIIHGQGTFVRREHDYSYSDNKLATFFMLEKESVLDVLEVRRTIEQLTVRLAAEKSTLEEIVKLEKIYIRLEKLLQKPDEYNHAEKDFHLELARIGKNPILLRLLSIILNSFHEELSSHVLASGLLQYSLSTILAIIECIKRNDADGAVANMTLHIDAVLEKTGKGLEAINCRQVGEKPCP